MSSKHKTPLLGWHPPAGLSVWVRDEAERRGVSISVLLNEAVETYRYDTRDEVTPEDEALVILDGAGNPYEWQPTISAAQYANYALQEPVTRLDVIRAYVVGYNKGASDEQLRGV